MIRLLLRALGGLAAVLVIAWGALALAFAGPGPAPLPAVLAVAWALAAGAALLVPRGLARKLGAFTVAVVVLAAWWASIRPSNDRAWQPDVARPPRAELHGDLLTIENVRNFDYRSETDFTPRWERRTFDLSRLRGLDLFLSYWGSPAIAHTIMSWEFDDGQHLAISIETRKEIGESYSAIAGFFKNYELYYVVADERDVVRLRTNYRGEDVYLYPLRTPVDRARRILLDYVAAINRLAARPAFYRAATQNCTTTIRTHVLHIGVAAPWDWRLLATGYVDEMLYDRGGIDTSRPFAEVKAASHVSARAQAADGDADFSRRIRAGMARPSLPPAR